MNFSVNPLEFQSTKIKTDQEQGRFLYRLATLLSQIAQQVVTLSTFNGLSAILNSGASLNNGALAVSTNALGSVNTNQVVDCKSATSVVVSLTFSASITLTLNNLGLGVPVEILASSTGVFTFKMAATLPGGSAYSAISFFTGGAGTSLITTGWAASAATRIFTGTTNTPSTLQMAFT